MSVNVKTTINLRHQHRRLHSGKILLFTSLLFVLLLFSSGFIYVFSGGAYSFALGVSNKVVSNETDLRNAVNDVSGSTTIALNNDITLTETLVIPANKDITLTSTSASKFFKLIGGYRDLPADPYNPYYPTPVITVKGGGVLRLDGIVVTCAHFTWNKIIRVDVCGALILCKGEISGSDYSGDGVDNSGVFTILGGTISNVKPGGQGNGRGNGVSNSGYGTFSMFGGEISNNIVGVCNAQGYNGAIGESNYGTFSMSGGVISNNDEGGVQNSGVFSMFGGEISKNVGGNLLQSGGGVSNSGVFSMRGGMISNNQATYGGGVYNWPDGNFSLFENGIISNNKAQVGGGVYNAGTFNRRGGVISDNTATQYSDIYHSDNSITNDDKTTDYRVFVGSIVVIVSVIVGGVFFYFKKNTKKQMTNKQNQSQQHNIQPAIILR